METIYRQLGASKLSPELRTEKNLKDFEYKGACDALSTPFYTKKHSTGVTPEEEETYKEARAKLWDDWKFGWAIPTGVYEIVTPEQQLAENEARLNDVLAKVNEIRTELAKAPLELKTTMVQI